MPIYPDGTDLYPVGGGTYLGEIREFLLPPDELLKGWFTLTGDGLPLICPEGQALLRLSKLLWWKKLEANWTDPNDQEMKIKVTDDLIYLPKWFIPDGRYPITRPGKNIGCVTLDAIPNITGAVSRTSGYGAVQCYSPAFSGAFYGKTGGTASWQGNTTGTYNVFFDASRIVSTANENRILSRDSCIAINLMVN